MVMCTVACTGRNPAFGDVEGEPGSTSTTEGRGDTAPGSSATPTSASDGPGTTHEPEPGTSSADDSTTALTSDATGWSGSVTGTAEVDTGDPVEPPGPVLLFASEHVYGNFAWQSGDYLLAGSEHCAAALPDDELETCTSIVPFLASETVGYDDLQVQIGDRAVEAFSGLVLAADLQSLAMGTVTPDFATEVASATDIDPPLLFWWGPSANLEATCEGWAVEQGLGGTRSFHARGALSPPAEVACAEQRRLLCACIVD